jgi:hypothetical protein
MENCQCVLIKQDVAVVKKNREIAGILLGVLFIAAGILFIFHPQAALVFHQDQGDGLGNFVERVSKRQNRICGFLDIVLGAGLICACRWPKFGGRRSAIDDYVWKLSQKLAWNFGTKTYYDIEQVTRVARGLGCDMAYIAYAHAMFCSRADFDDYYGPLRVRCTYDGLRAIIGRRYFVGAYGFNAASIVRLATPPEEWSYNFYEGGGI